MSKIKKLLAVSLLIPSMASAEFLTGNELLSRIQDSELIPNMVALGYVMGVADVTMNFGHCAPSRVTSGQARDVVKQYLIDNPSVRDMSADVLITSALGKAWPCPKKGKKTS